MEAKIKVCSFNLRVDTPIDGINRFRDRAWRVFDVIEKEKPDIIGFQEATDMMRDMLRLKLPEYTVIGCGRDSDCHGESAAVAVKTSAFEIVSYESFWLSFTPSVPGSTFGNDQSHCPRITTSVLLKPKASDRMLRFVNTHLDHKGNTARLLGASQIMQYLSVRAERFVLTGDFNAKPLDSVISAVTANPHFGRPVTEITRGIEGTFHAYGARSPLSKIDYIFTDSETDPADAYVVAEPPIDGVYVSDHHPVFAYITV